MKIETDDILFNGACIFKNVPRQTPTQFQPGSSIPNIVGNTVAICSGAVDTITNILGGVDGQDLRLLGDGTTTVDNNTHIKTSTGANKLLSVNKIYTFTYFDSLMLWIENA